MLRLKLVVSAEDEAASHASQPEMLQGTKVLAELVRPWAGSGRVVYADSYFDSVQAAEQLMSMGLRFIGVVKAGTRKFPMRALGSLEMSFKGEMHIYVQKGGDGAVVVCKPHTCPVHS
jgi:Transposase IS4